MRPTRWICVSSQGAPDGSGHKLVINGHIDNAAASDWDVALLPSGFRVMKTTDSITAGYRLILASQCRSESRLDPVSGLFRAR